jgi:hypothetical protein
MRVFFVLSRPHLLLSVTRYLVLYFAWDTHTETRGRSRTQIDYFFVKTMRYTGIIKTSFGTCSHPTRDVNSFLPPALSPKRRCPRACTHGHAFVCACACARAPLYDCLREAFVARLTTTPLSCFRDTRLFFFQSFLSSSSRREPRLLRALDYVKLHANFTSAAFSVADSLRTSAKYS